MTPQLTDDWIVPATSAIPHPLRSAAIARPDGIALVADDGEWTAARLVDRVALEAARLAERGVAAGMRVVLCGIADSEWVIAFHALGWLGAAVAPLATDGADTELTRDVATLAPDYVVMTQGAPEILATTVSADRLVRLRLDDDTSGERAPERFWPWSEPRLVVLTSGTTGTPRPIVLTTQQITLQAFGSAIRLEHHSDDRWLACLPLHHVGGVSILLRCAFYGTTVVLHSRFVAARVARALDMGQATMVSLVPTMLERVLDIRDAKPFPASLRVALIGGAKTDAKLIERCQALHVPIALTWGMSEAASQVATRVPGDAGQTSGSGAPLAFARVRTNDGLLEIVGPTVGGVLTTRDRGHIDDLGHIHVDGRDDGIIVSGGEKIDPLELERVLARHAAVRDVCVLGIPSARWGERPVALLVKDGDSAEPSSDELDVWCATHLSRFKTPDRYVWVDSLTTSAMDKRSRMKLRELLRTRAPELFAPVDADPAQRLREGGREGRALEGRKIDERVDEPSRGADHTVRSAQAVHKSHRSTVGAVDGGLDANALAEPNGAQEIGLGMDDRRRPRIGIEHRLDAARRHGKKLFVSLLAVLEHPRKEDDASAIDLAKAHSDRMLEAHERKLLEDGEDV